MAEQSGRPGEQVKRPKEIRLDDGTLALAVPAELCELVARVLTDVDANHRRANYGVGIFTSLLQLRDDMERIARIARTISPKRNKPDENTGRRRQWGTVTEAASALGLGERRVQQLAKAGELGAIKVGRVWLIPLD